MEKRIILIGLFVLYLICLYFAIFGPTRRMQVKILKKRMPEVLTYIEKNIEFLVVLLNAKEKLRALNNENTEVYSPNPWYYYMKIRNGRLLSGTDAAETNDNGGLSLMTERERNTANIGLLCMPGELGSVYIYKDRVDIYYDHFISTWIVIKNPVVEIDDPGKYGGRFEFTVKATDDWCISICTGS
ncbi:MAG: hypothetical protein FWH33_03075 [Oscillospiraceae bacterium]|nr:hypothetical protein [Oscillospiraceae bacterium]